LTLRADQAGGLVGFDIPHVTCYYVNKYIVKQDKEMILVAELLWKHSEGHRALASAIIKLGDNVTVKTTSEGLIVKGTTIKIPYAVADRHLKLSARSNGDMIWRALIMHRKGNLTKFDQDVIILADEEEKGEWTSIRVRRPVKEQIEEWAAKLAMSQAELIERAFAVYIGQFGDE
jgi:hypothetical protein